MKIAFEQGELGLRIVEQRDKAAIQVRTLRMIVNHVLRTNVDLARRADRLANQISRCRRSTTPSVVRQLIAESL